MFRMYAIHSHSYTHLILALGIVREATVWVFITSKYPGIHAIGLPSVRIFPRSQARECCPSWLIMLGARVLRSARAGMHMQPRILRLAVRPRVCAGNLLGYTPPDAVH